VELWAVQQREHVESLLTETSALGRIVEVTSIAFADARRGFEANPYQDPTEPPEIMAEVNACVFGPMVQGLIAQGNETGELHVYDPEMTAAFAMAIGVEAIRMMRADPSRRAPRPRSTRYTGEAVRGQFLPMSSAACAYTRICGVLHDRSRRPPRSR
jgi:hypothetical protein